ncbi:MAG TPA: phytanoyl-CoA dioxygenase family protein [Limnochordia bacterium]
MATPQAPTASGCLHPDQIDFFQHSGYLLVKGAIPPSLVEALRVFTQAQIDNELGTIIWHDRANKVPTRLSFLSERGGAYLDLIRHPCILDPLESLVGPNIEFCHNRHNHLLFKPPGDNGSIFHRDQAGWSHPVVTVLAYLDDATLENGCLEIVPGSHRRGVYERMYLPYRPPSRAAPDDPPGLAELTPEEKRLVDQAVPLLLHAGDLVFMHCCVLHGAPPNVSQGTRRSIQLAYHGSDELQPADAAVTMLVRGQRKEAKPGYRYKAG